MTQFARVSFQRVPGVARHLVLLPGSQALRLLLVLPARRICGATRICLLLLLSTE
jgi:hypothetical protein